MFNPKCSDVYCYNLLLSVIIVGYNFISYYSSCRLKFKCLILRIATFRVRATIGLWKIQYNFIYNISTMIFLHLDLFLSVIIFTENQNPGGYGYRYLTFKHKHWIYSSYILVRLMSLISIRCSAVFVK